VIIFTADVPKVKALEFQARGAADCLYKPFLPNELLSKVKEFLEKKS
jgi:DNA-binding response OmpR family regulator